MVTEGNSVVTEVKAVVTESEVVDVAVVDFEVGAVRVVTLVATFYNRIAVYRDVEVLFIESRHVVLLELGVRKNVFCAPTVNNEAAFGLYTIEDDV